MSQNPSNNPSSDGRPVPPPLPRQTAADDEQAERQKRAQQAAAQPLESQDSKLHPLMPPIPKPVSSQTPVNASSMVAPLVPVVPPQAGAIQPSPGQKPAACPPPLPVAQPQAQAPNPAPPPLPRQTTPSEPQQVNAPAVIGDKYQVIDVLGQGGMGVVLKARNIQLQKTVAIKVLNAALLVDKSSRARFEMETTAGAKLSHPHLVSVFDAGFTAKGEPYLVMEFIEGASLEQLLAQNNVSTRELLQYLIQTAKALRYLHDNKIVHRDLKTSNVMIQSIGEERYAKLFDLGIAKIVSQQGDTISKMTSTGTIFGSAAYMSPEQCQGHKVDSRADIYSFGCVMYECIAGHLPFAGEALGIMFKHLSETPPPFQPKNQMEANLIPVILKCMEKNPSDRFSSVSELIDALTAIEMGGTACLSVASPAKQDANKATSSSSLRSLNGGNDLKALTDTTTNPWAITPKLCVQLAAVTAITVVLAVGVNAWFGHRSSPATSAANKTNGALNSDLSNNQSGASSHADGVETGSAPGLANVPRIKTVDYNSVVKQLSVMNGMAASGAKTSSTQSHAAAGQTPRAVLQQYGLAEDDNHATPRGTSWAQKNKLMTQAVENLRAYDYRRAHNNWAQPNGNWTQPDGTPINTASNAYPQVDPKTGHSKVYDAALGEVPPGLPPEVAAFLKASAAITPAPHKPGTPYTPLEVTMQAGQDRAKYRDQAARLGDAVGRLSAATEADLRRLNPRLDPNRHGN